MNELPIIRSGFVDYYSCFRLFDSNEIKDYHFDFNGLREYLTKFSLIMNTHTMNDNQMSYKLKDNLSKLIVDIGDEKLIVQLPYLEKIHYSMDLLVRVSNDEFSLTNSNWTDLKFKVALIPFMYQPVDSDNKEFATVILSVFKSGLAILHTSHKIINENVDELSLNAGYSLYDKVQLPGVLLSDSKKTFKKFGINPKNIIDISDKYIDYLKSKFSNKNYTVKRLVQYHLMDYAFRPKEMDSYSSNHNFLHLLHKLLYSPVDKYNGLTDKQVKHKIPQHHYEISRHSSYFVSDGYKLVIAHSKSASSIVSKSIEENSSALYFAGLSGSLVQVEHLLIKDYANGEFLINSINTNMSITDLLLAKTRLMDTLSIVQSRIDSGFSSMNKLHLFMEQRMMLISQEDIVKQRTENIEEIIHLKEQSSNTLKTTAVAIFSLILTAFLSPSAIKDLLEMFGFDQSFILPTWLFLMVVNVLIIILLFTGKLKKIFKKNIKKP